MKEEKDILNNLKRTDKQSVPEGFFDSFSDNLMSKLENNSFLENLQKNKKPEIPTGFFDSFANDILMKVEETPIKKTKIISIRLILAGASIAAMFTLFIFNTNYKSDPIIARIVTEEIMVDEMVDEMEVEDLDDYLAYIDESTIIDFIVEHDLNIKDVSDVDESIYYEVESELDSYYYGL
jgi:hypothetical protein